MRGMNPVRRLIIKEKGRMWPTVSWRDSQLVVYYLGEEDEDVSIEETRKIDFEELILRLDQGKSVFMTMRPRGEGGVAP